MRKPYRCPPFDLNDRTLIQEAFRTGQPAHVDGAIAAAVDGFARRLRALPNGLPQIDGRPHLLIKAPGNFFDEYVIAITLQRIADRMGQSVTVLRQGPPGEASRSASPDIEFLP